MSNAPKSARRARGKVSRPRGSEVVVYWRPGCGFCASLLTELDRAGLEFAKVNIWDDPRAAQVVRRHNNGNETVPTVVMGDVVLTNPPGSQVLRTVAERSPHLLPEGYEPPQPGRFGRFVTRVLGGN